MSNGCINFSYDHIFVARQIQVLEKDHKNDHHHNKNKKESLIDKNSLSSYTNRYLTLK